MLLHLLATYYLFISLLVGSLDGRAVSFFVCLLGWLAVCPTYQAAGLGLWNLSRQTQCHAYITHKCNCNAASKLAITVMCNVQRCIYILCSWIITTLSGRFPINTRLYIAHKRNCDTECKTAVVYGVQRTNQSSSGIVTIMSHWCLYTGHACIVHKCNCNTCSRNTFF